MLKTKPANESILVFCSTVVLIAVITFYLVAMYFVSNPMNPQTNRKPKLFMSVLFPQGWSFFTKDARDPNVLMIDCNTGKMQEVNLKNSSIEFDYGLSRKNRIYFVEINNILQKASKDPGSRKYEVKLASISQINNKLNADTMVFNDIKMEKNYAVDFKGKYLLGIEKTLPWPLMHKKRDYPKSYIFIPVNVI